MLLTMLCCIDSCLWFDDEGAAGLEHEHGGLECIFELIGGIVLLSYNFKRISAIARKAKIAIAKRNSAFLLSGKRNLLFLL